MGEVYEATHTELDRRYAVKLLSRRSDGDDGGLALARFEREAQVAQALKHPHVVEIVEYQIADQGLPYIVMEYLDGEDLAQRIRRKGHVQPAETIRIIDAIAEALDAANAVGIVHRDLQPANVFLAKDPEPDFVKVLDFGVSKMFEWATITSTHTLVGTPQYMSPEQADGSSIEITHQSDVFSLGVIAYEMLTGKRAFTGKSIPALLYQIVHVDPPLISSLLGPRAAELDAVFEQVLSKQPQGRPTSASKFAAALRAGLGQLLPSFAIEPEATDPADELGRKKTTVRKAPTAPPVESPLDPPSIGGLASGGFGGITDVDQHTAPGGRPLPAFSPLELATPSRAAEVLPGGLPPPSAAEPAVGGRARFVVVGLSLGLLLAALGLRAFRVQSSEHGLVSGELESAAPHADVRITVRVTPPQARVMLDGMLVENGVAVVPWRAQPRRLRVSLEGHQQIDRAIDATDDRTLALELLPETALVETALVSTKLGGDGRSETRGERAPRGGRTRPAVSIASPQSPNAVRKPVIPRPTAPVQDL